MLRSLKSLLRWATQYKIHRYLLGMSYRPIAGLSISRPVSLDNASKGT